MKNTRMLIALGAALSLAVSACGSDDSDNASAAAPGNGADRAFVAAMIPHHESAVQMAEIAQTRGESKFVKDLADDIVRTQTTEIQTLREQDGELARAGIARGDLGLSHDMMGMGDDPAMLTDADPFDAEFIDMMVPHHEGAVAMAKAELLRGVDPELKALAQDIIDAQQREISEMRRHVNGGGDGGASMEGMEHE